MEKKSIILLAIYIATIALLLWILSMSLGKGKITGFAVLENQPIEVRLIETDYGIGEQLVGDIKISKGKFPSDTRMMILIDKIEVFDSGIDTLIDKYNIPHTYEGEDVVIEKDMIMNLLDFKIRSPDSFGLYNLIVRFSGSSMEDSAVFDVIS